MKLYVSSWLVLSLILPFCLAAQDVESFHANLASKSLLLDIDSTGNQLVVVGERGHILRSADGDVWQQVVVPSMATLTAVCFIGEQGWAVGHDTTILFSQDAGLSWQVQHSAPDRDRPLLDVLFLDQQTGIAIGAYGTFLRTIDGGLNWTKELHPEFLSAQDRDYLEEVRVDDEAFYLEEMSSILPHLNRISQSGDRLYIAGEAGLLAFSADQGLSWTRMDIDYSGSFFDIAQTASGRLLASGLRGHLFEYDTQQQVWNNIETGSKSSLNSIVSVDDKRIFIVGNNGNIVELNGTQISLRQTKDSKAIINALVFGQQLIAVTGDGIKHLQMEPVSL
jgi:photosystem II stability/assembly factor-like uncharacterized protein